MADIVTLMKELTLSPLDENEQIIYLSEITSGLRQNLKPHCLHDFRVF